MKFRRLLSTLTAGCLLLGCAAALPSSAANYTRASVHDPSIVKLQDGSYYIIGSHLGAARSTDLGNWTAAANSNLGSTATTFFKNIYTDLAIPEKWSNTTNGYNLAGNMWAPDIIYNKAMGKYCMYLSVNGQVWNSSVVLCTADNIDGPYTYQGTIVYSGFTNNAVNNVNDTDVPKVLGNNPDISRYLSNGSWNAAYGTNAIDPAVFYDEQGKLWMVYGSWFGGLYMLELDENTGLRDYNVKYATVANESDAYMGKKVAGGNYASGEGPYIEYMKAPGSNKGYYYLFISYGFFNSNGGYNMRIFRSESPDGPYVDQNGNSAVYPRGGDNIGGTVGERLMSNYQWDCNDRPFKAQGHNSVLMDDDGKLFCIYHTKFDDPYGFHEVRVHQMIMNEDGWPTAAAYEYTGETLSEAGHTMEAVTGEYEFIFHTLNQAFVNEQSADVEHSKDIVLNADGTVTGDISGTWKMYDGSPEMTLNFGGVTYKGSFLVQADESAAMTQKMTFTATGNNTCVWGSKKNAYKASEDLVNLTNMDSKLVYNADSAGGYGESVRLCDTSLLSGVSYTITNKNSGMALDLAGGGTTDGTNIQQWNLTGGSHQEWRIVAEENGYCRIVSMTDEGKCISVSDNSAENGLNVELQTFTGADNQLWKLVQNGSHYGIVSKCSDDKAGLDVYDWSTENGGNINQWEYWGGDCQLWRINAVHPFVNSGSYTIRNVNSGHFLADDNGNAVQSSAEIWTLTSFDDGTYTVQDADGKALTVENSSAEDGANVLLTDPDGSNAQKFTLQCNKDGSYSLMTVVSGSTRCADVFEISTEDGANICQWEYWGGDGQKFILEPAAAETEPPTTEPTTTEPVTTEPTTTEPVTETTATETDTTPGETAKPTLYGDVNEDGTVSIVDVIKLNRKLLGTDSISKIGSLNADVTQDQVADANDSLMILKSLVDLLTLPTIS